MEKERKVVNPKEELVFEKTVQSFSFYWKWDMESSLNHSFFWQLSPWHQTQVSEGPVEFFLELFSSFFKNMDYDLAARLIKLARPRM